MRFDRRMRRREQLPRFPYRGSFAAWFFLLVLVLFFVPQTLRATDFSSSNFKVRDPVSSSGGSFATSSSFQLWSSFAQPAIGKSTSASNELRAGFFYFTDVSPTPPPPPPPEPPPSTGLGSVPPPPPPSGTTTPPFISPFISFLLWERIPPACARPGLSRSDFNCDGNVDLKDLSILLTQPKFVTGRVLSFLFADWTKILPIPFGAENLAWGGESVGGFPKPPAGLAEVSESAPRVATTTERKGFAPAVKSFVKAIWSFVKTIARAVLRLFWL